MTSNHNPKPKLTADKKGRRPERLPVEEWPRHEDNDGSYMLGDIRVYPLSTVVDGVLTGRRSDSSTELFAEMREQVSASFSPHVLAHVAQFAEVVRRLDAGRTS